MSVTALKPREMVDIHSRNGRSSHHDSIYGQHDTYIITYFWSFVVLRKYETVRAILGEPHPLTYHSQD